MGSLMPFADAEEAPVRAATEHRAKRERENCVIKRSHKQELSRSVLQTFR